MKELLKEVFFLHMSPPEDIEDLSIEGLIDVVEYIEKNKSVYFRMENKPNYGHHASFWESDTKCVGESDFCEFRLEAIADAITNFLEE